MSGVCVKTTVMLVVLAGVGRGGMLVDYQADAVPLDPWVRVSDGPPSERSQHETFATGGVLTMIDSALFVGNTLGYYHLAAFDPETPLDVEFRARVLWGESALGSMAPFSVWMYNGAVYADMSVGPNSVTAIGAGPLLLNEMVDGTDWHTYRYRVGPQGIDWWMDGEALGSATTDMLIPHPTTVDRRINMMITSASGYVELDYLTVVPEPGTATLAILGLVLVGGRRRRFGSSLNV